MSSLSPPEKRNARSSASPTTIRPPVRAWTMLSIPSRSAVPGATISSAFTSRGSWRDSSSSLSSSPVRGAIPTPFYRVCLGFSRSRRTSSAQRDGASAFGGTLAFNAQRAQRGAQRSHLRRDDRRQPELARLGDAPVGVRDRAQLAGQAELAEAGERRRLGGAVGIGSRAARQRHPARGARDRQRD